MVIKTSKLLKNSDGATLIEYALIACLIAIVAIVAMSSVGSNISERFNTVASEMVSK
jgi:pilus assembly protein Flp/PilA